VDVNLPELNQILEQARQTPLSEPDYRKLQQALHALAELLRPVRSTEKTKSVLTEAVSHGVAESSVSNTEQNSRPGHGRNGAAVFTGARRVPIRHAQLQSSDGCPACEIGKVYRQKKPKPLVRIVGQAPLAATVYELELLRCNTCGQVFTAEEPEEVGPDQYDESTAAMIAQLKYGSGVPFYRLEKLQASVGIPLPASTQWEIVEEEGASIKPAWDELIRQAAQGEVLYNDDTRMRVLRLAREPSDERTGVFTSGIVSTVSV
jgi:transposase